MPRTLIGLGSNLGDRPAALRRACALLRDDPSSENITVSTLHETQPAGGPAGQGTYLNAAVALDTTLAPEALHELLRNIERTLGRRPAPRWAARAIDVDLLLYGEQVVATPELQVPHPRMACRRFVLAPAAEVAGAMVHPLVGWTLERLLAHLDTAVPYVALLGMPGDSRPALAERVAAAVNGTYLADPTAGAAGDPSGHAEQRPIQFLDHAASVLASRDWRVARDVAISDFYFDEPLAYARAELQPPEYDLVREAWAARRDSVVAPKLLVVLDDWAAGIRARGETSPTGPGAEPLRHELSRLAGRGDTGPVLYAGRDNPQIQFEEITAAIAAMA